MISCPLTFTPDVRGLNAKLEEFRRVFRQNGQESLMGDFVRTQAGQLAADAAALVGPRKKKKLEKGITRDVNKGLAWRKRSRTLTGAEQSGDKTWLDAGPDFLLGVRTEDMHLDADGEQAYSLFRSIQKSPWGSKYVTMEKRGNQRIMIINRALVKRSAYQSVIAKVRESIGQAKASLAATAVKLLPGKTFPDWVTDKLNVVEQNGKTIFDDSRLTAASPEIVFGTRAPGMASNPYMIEALDQAVRKREMVADSTLSKLIDGFVLDINSGKVYKPRGGDQ